MSRLLLQLVVVSKSRSLKHASLQLGISQPALTRNMQRLEDSYGVPILERTSKGVKLTDFGQILVKRGKRIEHEHFLLEEELRAAMVKGKGSRLRVGAGPVWAAEMLPEAVLALHRTMSEVTFELHSGSQEEMLQQLSVSELDIVVASDTLPARSFGEFDFIPLWESSVLLVTSPTHPLQSAHSVSIDMIQPYPWVILTQSNDVVQILNHFFHEHQLPSANIAFRSAYWESIPAVVRESEHILVLPDRLQDKALLNGLRPLKCSELHWQFTSGAWIRKDITPTDAQKIFIECLREQVDKKRV